MIVSKIQREILKEVSLLSTLRRGLSNNVEDIFNFHGDRETLGFKDRYRVLDEKDYERFISSRSSKREPAMTRSLTSLSYKIGKQMISLAEGMPNEDIFPFSHLEIKTKSGGKIILKDKELAKALQYVPSQGLPELLAILRKFQEDLHRPPPLDRDVLVTNGSQHGIYQCVDMLVNPGDPVLTTEYTFTGFHSALRPYDPEVLTIAEDEDGLVPETLEALLSDRVSKGLKMPRILYLIPTGNNPTGTVIPLQRRKQIYELACRYDFIIIEDDPYAFLNYSDEVTPSFLSLDECGRVVRLDSVSKVVSAGLRGAWLTAPTALLRRAELHSQAELLHSCTLSQSLLLRLLSQRGELAAHLHSARSLYAARCGALGAAMGRVARDAQAHYMQPRAGLFYWLRLSGVPDVYNMVFNTALEKGLMLCPGQAFQYDTSAPSQHLRLTFSRIRPEDMEHAVDLLVDVIQTEQKLNQRERVATEG
ncbi:unnamed protein product [Leptidea sinapis]|uniref:Aminotransferase class I/classII large domain-containing protein n=1 Tax=Leptidea sinapis TaxID=189913 RepID=A0A5E4QD84_9NEOP|nr:unnamed protein product [Leptidea sinapis]